MKKKHCFDGTHLTLEERKIIQTGISNHSTKTAIAKTIGKDPTTVAKEIRNHRLFKPRNLKRYPVNCKKLKICRIGCKVKCSDFEELTCNFRDRSPGACNKCPKNYSCPLDKYFYSACKAHEEYSYDLVDARIGINLTTGQRDRLADVIVPLIKQGQSIYQILSSHPEISLSEKTIYNYIAAGVFKDFGIDDFSLKEKISRKQFKNKYKQRKEPANYDNHRYSDYLDFLGDNPGIPTVQMDTLYNSLSGPYIQTFLFEKSPVIFGFVHQDKTSDSMAESFDILQDRLGNDLFRFLFNLILTDRGVEFQKHRLFEYNRKTGEARLNIFYCDPMQSYQKAHIENSHNYLRDIIPNNVSLDSLTNLDLELAFSHINSTPRESLNGRTPYEVFEFFYSKDILDLLHIKQIDRDDIVLKPYLLNLPKN